MSTETGYAKLNLALHVRARREDGYHEIETLFAFVEDGDVVSLEGEPGLRLTGRFAGLLAGEGDNLVLRAERAYRAAFGSAEAGFRLDKTLPVAAGLGGGSADAAAALRLLCARDGRDPLSAEMMAIAADLGADVPACLGSTLALGRSRGDQLTPVVGSIAGTSVLLVNPGVPMPTGPVFAGWDRVDRGGMPDGDALSVARDGRNDLEAPAIAIAPVVGDALAALRTQPGVVLARMSGSGATCFAVFVDDAARDAADAALAASQPGWWRLATRFR